MTSQKFYLYKRTNGIWYIGYVLDGRRVWKSSGSGSKSDALKFLHEFEDHLKKDHPNITFSEFGKQFFELQATNLRQSTIKRACEPAFKAFLNICGNKFLSAYTVRDVETFKRKRLVGHSPTTVNIDFRTLRSAFNVALRWQYIAENPFSKTRQLRKPEQLPTHISKEDFQKLLGAVKEQELKELFLFAALTGLRLGEILGLSWNNIDFQRQQISIANSDTFLTKSGKGRIVPMNTLVLRLLTEKFSRRDSCDFIFHRAGAQLQQSYVSHKFKKYIRHLRLDDDLHFHSLRHTFATWLVQGGVNIYEVQKLLGHSSVKVTEVYSHLAASELHSSINRIQLPEIRQ